MALDTYANLKTAIADWAARTDTSVTDSVDDFIDMAEAKMWKKLRLRSMEQRSTATTSTSNRYLALPTDFVAMRRLRLENGDDKYKLRQYDAASLSIQSNSGTPYGFSVTSQIEFDHREP
jgi:hypothetical protein